MSVTQPTAAERPEAPGRGRRGRLRLLAWSVALAVGVGAGVLIGVVRSSHPAAIPAGGPVAPALPIATWPAGAKPAPDFALADENARPVSLAAFRGRPVLLTFIDPLCTTLCPLEAKRLAAVEAALPAAARPAIVAVSVNLWGNARAHLLADRSKWKLTAAWHWAVGSAPALRRVWHDYGIAVRADVRKVGGVTTADVEHTEAVFVIDARGDQRALFLYPFRAADVTRTVRQLAAAPAP